LISDSAEFQRLTDVYRGLSDDELLKLSLEIEDLTDPAKDALRSEMASRRLDPIRTSGAERDLEGNVDDVDIDVLGRFGQLSAPDCVWEFADQEDAQAAGLMLEEADIVYDLMLPTSGRFDMGAPRLAVLPADADRARDILSKPIPEELRIRVRTPDEFVPPNCPQCRSEDPLLEAIEPENKWLCEVCGHVWVETTPK
jgi:hypothetical protein